MDSWMQDVVSMMTDGSISRVKQEIETTSCCSPTPSNGNQIQSMVYNNNNSQASPGSPDRQFCSSTTTTLGDGIGDSGSQNSIKEEIPRRLCLVCGDIASGFHYGVASCEACKAFFKRTIQGNIEYTCPANNECEINKRRRKACQACRFQKCLLMGMLKEGVRLDRVRGGRQKYRRNPISNPYQMQVLYPSTTTSPTSLDDIKMLEVLASYDAEHLTVGPYSFSVDGKDEKRLPFDDKERFVDDEHELLDLISDLYDRDLVCIIGWAKQIPGFMELPINDQMKMLQVSWSEVHTLQLAYRSMPFTGKLAFAKDFSLDERCAKEIGLGEFYNHCVHIIQRLERLSWRKEEYYLLKALVLANCDIRLEEQLMLKKFRDSILNALNDCVYITRHNLAVSHQQQLLLILPALRQADPIIRKFWCNIHREGKTKMNRLLVEMLEPVSR